MDAESPSNHQPAVEAEFRVVERSRAWSRVMALLSRHSLRFDEERKRLLFAALSLIMIPMLLSFGSYYLFSGYRLLGMFEWLLAMWWMGLLWRMRHIADAKIHYRFTAIMTAVLFMAFATLGDVDSSRVLWVFTYPAFAMSIVGSREGIAYSLIILVWWLGYMLWPNQTTTESYGHEFIVRFFAVYMTIFLMALFIEMVRSRMNETMNRHRERLQTDRQALIEAERRMRQLALEDELTGAESRRSIMARLDVETDRARLSGSSLTVGMMDLDHFKQINDQHGHQTGDRVLAEVVRRVQSVIRDNDRIGRYGGEEFLLIFPGTSGTDLVAMADRILTAVRSVPVMVDETALTMSISLGLATAASAPYDAESLIRQSDQALYEAKAQGRDRVVVSQGTTS